jgi:uncharacterized protein (DUF885 family)
MPTPSTPIFELCDHHVTRQCELDPVAATYCGVTGDFAPGTDFSPDGHTARAELARDTLRQLAGLTPTGTADELAAGHLRERLEAELAAHEAGEHLRSLRAPFGLLQSLRNSVDLMPRNGRWPAVVGRVAAVPQMLASWRTSLATGIARGLVAAHRQAVEAASQAQRYADSGTFQAVVDEYGEGPLRPALTAAAQDAHAALADLARWLREEYAARAAPADGVGPERYPVASRLSLGADIDLLGAYEWAWAELRRIEDEMAAEARRVRPGAGIDEAVAHLNETAFLVGVDAYRGWLQERHDRAISALHGVHFDIAEPLRRVDVVTVENSSAGSAYYTPPRGGPDPARPDLVAGGRPGAVRGVGGADNGLPRGRTRPSPADRARGGGRRRAVPVREDVAGECAQRGLGALCGAARRRAGLARHAR